LFDVDVNRGHGGDKGIGLKVDKYGDNGIDVLPAFKVENAGGEISLIREFKMSVLSVDADDVVGINGIDPGEDMSGERVGVEEMAELSA